MFFQAFPISSATNNMRMLRSREVIFIDEDPKLWPFSCGFREA
jgi:hypothetical protein